MTKGIPTPEEALQILRRSGCSAEVIKHCEAVSKLAVEIARKCRGNGLDVDVELVRVGALLHDVGRSRTHGVDHPIVGSRLARSYGLPDEIVRIIERHLGGGLTAEEAGELGWPRRDYLPETIEEKIVTYADKLIEGGRAVPIEETIKKLRRRLGANHPSIKRIMNLHREMMALCGSP